MKIIHLVVMLMLILMPNGNNIRYDTAVVTETYYDSEEDANITCFATSDGNEWAAMDVDIPEGTNCVVKFDTRETKTVLDDVILSIICD